MTDVSIFILDFGDVTEYNKVAKICLFYSNFKLADIYKAFFIRFVVSCTVAPHSARIFKSLKVSSLAPKLNTFNFASYLNIPYDKVKAIVIQSL